MPALVAVSHGTSSPAGRVAVRALVDAVDVALPGTPVHEAFVDVQQPALPDVLGRQSGPAVVVPLLLAPGFHVHVDIAQAVAGQDAVAAPTLGPDPALTGVVLDRLAEAGLREDDAVVLGVAGSSDPRARLNLDHAAADLADALRRPVDVGHLGGHGRGVDDVVHEAGSTGRRVVVASYLVAPGFFADRLSRCGADVVTAPLLDDRPVDARLIDLVLERHRVAAARGLAGVH